jgi:hypothetical protein
MQGFVSYSHDDYGDFKILQKHLKQVELGTGFDFWCDERIDAGYVWDAAIRERIRMSQVFLLLASPNYFAAEYVIGSELPAIRNSQRIDDALFIPVILAPCDWEDLLKVPQSVPIADKRRVKPISKWEDKADGFNAVREQVKATLARPQVRAAHRVRRDAAEPDRQGAGGSSARLEADGKNRRKRCRRVADQ